MFAFLRLRTLWLGRSRKIAFLDVFFQRHDSPVSQALISSREAFSSSSRLSGIVVSFSFLPLLSFGFAPFFFFLMIFNNRSLYSSLYCSGSKSPLILSISVVAILSSSLPTLLPGDLT